MCFEKLGYTSQMLQAFISGTFWIDCLITCKLPLVDKITVRADGHMAVRYKDGLEVSVSEGREWRGSDDSRKTF